MLSEFADRRIVPFGDAGLPLAPGQLCHDLAQRHVARFQHDQQVKEHVGGLGGQAVAVALGGLDDGLDRLFAEFLGAFLRALGKEFGGPAAVRIGALAGDDGGGEGGEGGHVSLIGMPAAAMCCLASAMV